MENILQVNLETQTAPKVMESTGKEWITYGTDDWENLYPQFLIDLYYNSSTHAAIINATRDMIAGEGISCDEGENLEQYVKFKKFLHRANGRESLHDIIKKLAFDYKLQGGFALNIIWNKTRTEISEIYHVPVERLRAGKPNEYGVVDTYWICSDWSNTRKNKPQPVPAFDLNDRTSASQILYDGDYSPNMDIYFTPDYSAACNWCLVDQKVAEFHLSNISNGFSGSYFISFANGVPTAEERFQIERSLAEKFTGAKASGKFVLTFSDDQTRTPEITPISVSNADKQYLALQELLVQNILTGHRVTSPMLMGIKNQTGLGSNVDELNSAFEVYLNTVVKPYQDKILRCIGHILDVNKIGLPIEIIQNKPITSKWSVEDMKSVMTQDEIREEMGLPPLSDNDKVEEDKNEFAKVGTMITDGVELPLFETIDEAIAEAERLGCTGYHEHTQDGNTYYMPCEDHDQTKSLFNDCGCKEEFISPNPCQKGYEPYGHKIKRGRKVPNCVPIQASELEKFIHAYGEDIDENEWELVNTTEVDNEVEDFNFETELNTLHKVELASTGRAIPNAKSGQDQTSKQTNYVDDIYRVRYVYDGPGGERDFCKGMILANKAYRKEDIIRMGKQAVNPGFGPGGSDTYSIWKYKGGVNCYHRWFRKIYVTKKGERPSNTDSVITSTEARSRGVKLPRNAQEVSVAPIKMPDQGRKN